MRLKNKICVVTGSSRGIGAAIARGYAKEGATVVITYREKKKEALAVAKETGSELVLKMDIRDRASIRSAFKKVHKRYGRIDVLVNNAGTNRTNDFDKQTQEEWDEVIDVDLTGVFRCCQEALPYIPDCGRVINIGSLSGEYGGPPTPSDPAAKTRGNAQAPGFAYADAGATVDTYDARGQASFAKAYNKKRKIDGVMTLASDIPHIVSFVARALNLPAHPLSTAKRASDKLLMKRTFARRGVPIPFFKEIKSVSGLERFAGRHGYPVVVKPADSRGARGVCIVAEGGASLRRALASARAESPSKRVMVETFLPGPQLSTESVVYRGRIVCTVVAERNYGGFLINPPYAIEDGGETPADLSAAQRRAVDLVLTRAARAMGITDGSMKGDLVYTAAGPKIIEVAARLSGGDYATDTIPLATGVG